MSAPLPDGAWRLRLVEAELGYDTPCLIWTGALDGHGYGQVQIARRLWLVHRLAWTEACGDPGDLHVLHHCDHPPCVRLDHLFLGSNAANVADKVAKGRAAAHKLTPDDVLGIRALLASGVSQESVAAKYGVCQSLVSRIKRGVLWSHVNPKGGPL